MITREQVQQRAIKLAETYERVLLQWSTGVGKTYPAIKFQEKYNYKTLVCVPQVSHIQNWKDEYIKYGCESLLLKTEFTCYASLKKQVDNQYDTLVLDEGHNATSEIRTMFLGGIRVNKVIALTATIRKEQLYELESVFGKFQVDTMTLKQAITNNILPEPQIILVPLILRNGINNTDNTCEYTKVRGNSKKRTQVHCTYRDRFLYLKNKVKYPDLELIVHCTEREKYTQLCEDFEYYKRLYMMKRQEFMKTKWLLEGSNRKRFLGSCKTPYVSNIIKALIEKEKRFICFCSSIDQVTSIVSETGANPVHSQEKDALGTIDKFNSKEIDNLVAVGMLQEGMNLVDIEMGVICQLDGYDRGCWQKLGRSMRAKDPIQIILYYPGTRDEDWLLNITDKLDPTYIRELSMDELFSFIESL